jgi:hypothetical protein
MYDPMASKITWKMVIIENVELSRIPSGFESRVVASVMAASTIVAERPPCRRAFRRTPCTGSGDLLDRPRHRARESVSMAGAVIPGATSFRRKPEATANPE